MRVARGNIGEEIALTLLGTIRADAHVARSVKQRIIVCKELANIAAAGDMERIALRLTDKVERKMLIEKGERGIGSFFKKLLGQF